jgi:hypothetical protein
MLMKQRYVKPKLSETVLCVINTTNWMDSHRMFHIPGIWNKSLKDNPTFKLHLQEHICALTCHFR